MRPPRRLTCLVTATTLVGLVLAGCSVKDPWANPACTQLPATAIRGAVTDLGAISEGSPRTGPDGAETGRLPATNPSQIYWCKWPAANPDNDHAFAFTATVQATDPDTYAQLTQSVMAENGPILTSTVPGQGRAWARSGEIGAMWLCPRHDHDYTSQRLTVYVYRPAHKQDPASDAKSLAEAIIPLTGCI
jgi:hypothetical protein